MSKDAERVLCVPREVLELACGGELFQGYQHATVAEGQDVLATVLHDDVVRFMRRGDCEDDPSLKQIIPYVALLQRFNWEDGNGRILRYNRAAKGEGESRLSGLATVGIGGHINRQDYRGDLQNTFLRAYKREITEEVRIESPFEAEVTGFINDDSDAVGQVHFGVLIVLRLQLPCVYPNESNIVQPHFVPLDHLCRDACEEHDEFETWSRIVLTSHAFGHRRTKR